SKPRPRRRDQHPPPAKRGEGPRSPTIRRAPILNQLPLRTLAQKPPHAVLAERSNWFRMLHERTPTRLHSCEGSTNECAHCPPSGNTALMYDCVRQGMTFSLSPDPR